VDVEVGIRLVVRHVIDYSVHSQSYAIRDADTQTSESARAIVVRVSSFRVVRAFEAIVGAHGTTADDELALASHEVAERKVVVQTQGECGSFDLFSLRAQAADHIVRIAVLWRVITVTFDLEAGIGKKYTDAAAVTETILRNRTGASGILVEPGPLRKAADFDGPGEWRIEIIPPHDRSPQRAATHGRPAATEHGADIGRELQACLNADVEVARLREVIEQRIEAQGEPAEPQIDAGQSLDTIVIRACDRRIREADVLENTAGADVE
jgi:hypothetical protein